MNDRIRLWIVSGSLVAGMGAIAWGQSARPNRLDRVITGREVIGFPEFQRTALRLAEENGVSEETAAQVLVGFAAANDRRVVVPAEWRYILMGGLFGTGVSYPAAQSFMAAIGREVRSAVDTGFLDAVRTVDLTTRLVRTVGDGSETRPPVPLEQPLPRYTASARAAGIEGVIVVKCVVLEDGSVANCRVIRSLGYGLDESTVLTIQDRWKFQPAVSEGRPVAVEANVEVSISLN